MNDFNGLYSSSSPVVEFSLSPYGSRGLRTALDPVLQKYHL
jgi:hypothetical protein